MYSEERVLFYFPYKFLCHGPWQSLVWNQVTEEQHCMRMGKQNNKWSFSATAEGLHCYSAPLKRPVAITAFIWCGHFPPANEATVALYV